MPSASLGEFNRIEFLHLIDAEIVDKDVRIRRRTHKGGGAFLCRGIREYAR